MSGNAHWAPYQTLRLRDPEKSLPFCEVMTGMRSTRQSLTQQIQPSAIMKRQRACYFSIVDQYRNVGDFSLGHGVFLQTIHEKPHVGDWLARPASFKLYRDVPIGASVDAHRVICKVTAAR